MIQRDKMVPLIEAKEQVRKIFIRLGMLHLSYAEILIEELGKKRGKELILKAIKYYGKKIGEQVKSHVASKGLDNKPANYIEDLPLYGMNDGFELVEVNGEKRVRVHGCVIADMWHKLDKDDLGRLYCYVDLAKYMSFNPAYKQVHLKAKPDGDQYCEFAIRSTSEQERKDFADNDKDWSYID